MINAAPSFNGLKTASINGHHFSNVDEGLKMLEEAEREARDQGFEVLIGPMEHGTWGAYRLVMYNHGEPPFMGEPQSGPYDLEAYIKAGFSIGEMHSSAIIDLTTMKEPIKRVKKIKITSWNGENPHELLTNVHRITMHAFAKTPLFTPIPVENFIDAYMPVLKRSDPRFMLTASNEQNEIVAFLLSYPAPNWHKTFIIKSYASVMPGAGRCLFDHILWQGHQSGYEQAVAGLMRDGNISLATTRHYGNTIFRRYALMEKRL